MRALTWKRALLMIQRFGRNRSAERSLTLHPMNPTGLQLTVLAYSTRALSCGGLLHSCVPSSAELISRYAMRGLLRSSAQGCAHTTVG